MLRPGEVRALLAPAVEGLLAQEPGEAGVVLVAPEDFTVPVVTASVMAVMMCPLL